MSLPKRVCVKVQYLRKHKPYYDNLEEWCNDEDNVLVTRNGRVFVGKGDDKRIFHYPKSLWANKYKVGDKEGEYTLSEALELFEEDLRDRLEDENTLDEFRKLLNAKRIGCFCDPNNRCHCDVILKLLEEKFV